MSKFKVGDEVLYEQWRAIGHWWPYVVIGIVPKRLFRISQRYIIQDPALPKDILTAKEKHLVHCSKKAPTPTVKGENGATK